jgi:hypothetical protein
MYTEGRGKERPQTDAKFHPSSCMEGLKKTTKICLKIEGLLLRIELGTFGMEVVMVAFSLVIL